MKVICVCPAWCPLSYNKTVPITKSNHCAYDTHYHLVFPVKYRKSLFNSGLTSTMSRVMRDIEERYELAIEQYGDDKNHIHLLVSFHPKYSIGQIVRLFKSITARELFLAHPELKRDLWGGEFWSDGYYASTVGTGGNWAVVEQYVKNQGHFKPNQLSLW
jgi:putative transposase